MIMSKQTPRSLTWAGAILLGAFGLALLPLVPVRAQEPEPGGLRVQFVQAGQADQKKAALDQQIEALRRVLESLEQQKRSQVKPAPAANPEEIKKARSELERLGDAVAVKKRELLTAERAFQEARARLAKLEGKGVALQLHWAVDPKDQLRWTVVPKDGMRVFGPDNVRGVIRLHSQVETRAVRAKPEDVNQRLDRLLREVEQLRQEIRRNRPDAPRGK